MADFTAGYWSWFIGGITLLSLIALLLFAWTLSARRSGDGPVGTSGHAWDEDLEEYNNPLPRWWLNLFYITTVWGILYLLAYPGLGAFKGLLAWSQEGQYKGEMAAADGKYAPVFAQYAAVALDQLAQDPKALVIGERLYSAYCTGCHGSDARGARGFPNLRDGDWLYGGDGAQIETSIQDGRQGIMPPWGQAIGADGVTQATAYVEQLAGRTTNSAAAAAGKQVFETTCVTCHGADGKGNPLLGAPNLTDGIWLYGGTTAKIAESIRAGRNGVMPAHQEFLGAAKVHLLAAYVLSLSGPAAPAPGGH